MRYPQQCATYICVYEDNDLKAAKKVLIVVENDGIYELFMTLKSLQKLGSSAQSFT